MSIQTPSHIDVEANWESIRAELLSVNREGVSELITYLEHETDFKTAPASSKFHNSFVGGLAKHSLNVLHFMRKLQKELDIDLPADSIIIVGLLHDICKANYYVIGQVLDYDYKDKTDKWRKVEGFKVEEALPVGHGDKSIGLILRHLTLTKAEWAAIRWHMGAWEVGVHLDPMISKPFRQSLNDFPLVKLTMIADQLAELYEVTNEAGTQQTLI